MKIKHVQLLVLLIQTLNVVWYGLYCYLQETPIRGVQWFAMIVGWAAWALVAYMARDTWKRDV